MVGIVGIILIVLAVLGMLARVARALILVMLAPSTSASEFIDAVAVGDERAAYDLLCEASQDQISLEEFSADFVPDQAVLRTQVDNSGGDFGEPDDISEVTFFLTDGSMATVTSVADVDPDRHTSNLFVSDPPRFQR